MGSAAMGAAVERQSTNDPSAFGFAAFAVTTYVMAVHNAGWAPDLAWLGLGLFHGGLAQLLAGMWEFKRSGRGSVFGATAFSTYGACWMAQALFLILSLAGLVPASVAVGSALGWFLSGFLVFNSYMLLAAAMVSRAVAAAFLCLELTLAASCAANLTGSQPWRTASGYLGLCTAAAAWYCSASACLNNIAGRVIVPCGEPFIQFRGSEDGREHVKPVDSPQADSHVHSMLNEHVSP